MIRELFLEDLSLWSCLWQSTLFAVIGLLGSFLLRRRPARASQMLFLAMVAAVIVPTMSVLVKHFELGMFTSGPIVLKPEVLNEATATDYEASGAMPPTDIQHEVRMGAGESPSVKAGSEGANIPWRKIVLYGWMITTLILLGRLFVAFVSGLCLLRRAQSQGCEQIRRAADSARAKLGITKGLQVLSSRDVHSPVIWCWSLIPVLLVPSDSDHEVDWEGVICHELAHWKRWDHISGLIAELVVCILPWNLLLWWSKKRMVTLSEQACDDWVVTGGQPCEDYAQSLLDFKPQKQVAFVPAVVTSKKTLAGRIRRILEQKCGNPHGGLCWNLVVAVITLCITVGVAFAQTRALRPTGTIKTKVGRSAVIEQLASAMMIKGRILDPNNNPAYLSGIVALPMTSYGAQIYLNNKEGYFELPWSPTWIEEGQAVCLIARGRPEQIARGWYESKLAAVVDVPDSTSPVTIHLEPGATLTGKVFDPNGQPIAEYRAILSLPTKFKCRAPIFADGAKAPGVEFVILPIPYSRKYKLTIQAEGYQTKQLTVDATDRSIEVIDIGTITLQPQDTAKPAIAEQAPNPDLMKEFHEIYRLEEGEVIKLIKTPFVLGRQEYLFTPVGPQLGGSIQMASRWDGELKTCTASTGLARLNEVLRLLLHIPVYDFKLPKELNVRLPHGDWIVREESSLQEQLRALEEIIYSQLHRPIRFEKRTAERDTIVATGRYAFTPLSDEHAEQLQIFGDRGFSPNVHEGEADSLSELFLFIAHRMNIPFKDRTEPTEIDKIRYRYDYGLFNRSRTEKYLPMILDAIAKQTGLQFKLERQPADIWFVTETKGN